VYRPLAFLQATCCETGFETNPTLIAKDLAGYL